MEARTDHQAHNRQGWASSRSSVTCIGRSHPSETNSETFPFGESEKQAEQQAPEIAEQQAREMTMSEEQLEDSGETGIQHDSISNNSSKESQDKPDSRPQRAAAIEARKRLAAYTSLDTE